MSVNTWSAEKQKLNKLAGNANIIDGAISEDSTWSSEKINASLGEKADVKDVGNLADLKTKEKTNLVGAINEASQSGGGSGDENIYSLEETVCGTWINGKPLYRKVINLGPGGAAGTYSRHNLGITHINEIVRLDWRAQGIFGTEIWQGANGDEISFWVESLVNKTVDMHSHVDMTGYPNIVLIIEYTKTTD